MSYEGGKSSGAASVPNLTSARMVTLRRGASRMCCQGAMRGAGGTAVAAKKPTLAARSGAALSSNAAPESGEASFVLPDTNLTAKHTRPSAPAVRCQHKHGELPCATRSASQPTTEHAAANHQRCARARHVCVDTPPVRRLPHFGNGCTDRGSARPKVRHRVGGNHRALSALVQCDELAADHPS